MRRMKKWLWLWGLLLLSPSLLAMEVGNAVPAFTVTSQDGKPLTQEDLLGKVSVLFYDTRHTASVNNDLKYEIGDFREANLPLLENLQVIQVIDASSANFLTRTIWRRKLRENARKYGTTLYADWSGKMRRDFGFSSKESNILVIDPQGRVRYVHQGNPRGEEREKLFALLLVLGKATRDGTI